MSRRDGSLLRLWVSRAACASGTWRPARESLRLPSTSLPAPVVEPVDRMLLAEPTVRPNHADTYLTLMGMRTAATTTTAILAGPESEPLAPTRLKGRGCARPPGGRRPRPPSQVLLGDSSGSSWNRERIRAHHALAGSSGPWPMSCAARSRTGCP